MADNNNNNSPKGNNPTPNGKGVGGCIFCMLSLSSLLAFSYCVLIPAVAPIQLVGLNWNPY